MESTIKQLFEHKPIELGNELLEKADENIKARNEQSLENTKQYLKELRESDNKALLEHLNEIAKVQQMEAREKDLQREIEKAQEKAKREVLKKWAIEKADAVAVREIDNTDEYKKMLKDLLKK